MCDGGERAGKVERTLEIYWWCEVRVGGWEVRKVREGTKGTRDWMRRCIMIGISGGVLALS